MIFLYRGEAILRIHNAFRRDLQRQRQVVADLRCENAQVVAPPIEVPRELSDADRSNHIGGREGKADDQGSSYPAASSVHVLRSGHEPRREFALASRAHRWVTA